MARRFSIETVFHAIDRVTKPINRMQNRVQKFSRSATKGLKSINRMNDKLVNGLKRSVTWLTATAAAGGASVVAFNNASAEAERLAQSVGLSVETLEALTAAVKPAGFQLDNMVDIVEEMNNKLGESRGLGDITTPVDEALSILGLRFKEIENLKPEEQFLRIADAALRMTDAQKAASAADILLGGEANKLIGVLRQQGKTIDAVIAKQKQFIFRTHESRQGALAFNNEWRNSLAVLSSLGAEISGLAGLHLAPLLQRLNEWAVANRELIQSRLVEFMDDFVENLGTISAWLKRVGASLAVWAAFTATLKTFIGIMTVVNLLMAANPIGLLVLGITAAIAAFTALVVWIDDVSAMFRGLNPILRFAFSPIHAVVETIKFIKDNIGSIIDAARKVGQFLGIVDGDDGEQAVVGGPGARRRQVMAEAVAGPQARTARSIEESRTTETAEVLIRDETGRAEMTQRGPGPRRVGLSLTSTGAM